MTRDNTESKQDDPFACPDCATGHLVKIGIDLYRCCNCRETFEAAETDE